LTWPRVRPALDKLNALLEAALAAVEPAQAVRRALRISGDRLRVGGHELRLRDFRRAIVVGAGKASAPMAAAVEEVIAGALPIEGSVTVRYGHAAPTRDIRVREASHPVPDALGVAATRAIVELLEGADKRDLVICVISGGGSALLTLPAEGISLEDMQRTTDALLRSGATINEMNVVRKHLDRVKGGGLARLAAPAQRRGGQSAGCDRLGSNGAGYLDLCRRRFRLRALRTVGPGAEQRGRAAAGWALWFS
jgi:glycerate 2-kinase